MTSVQRRVEAVGVRVAGGAAGVVKVAATINVGATLVLGGGPAAQRDKKALACAQQAHGTSTG